MHSNPQVATGDPPAGGRRMRSGDPPGRTRPLLLLSVLVLAGSSLLAAPPDLHGQVVQGHLTDARTRFAVDGVTVALRDTAGTVVARTATNFLGAFRLTAPGPGEYSLLAEALGYRSTDSPTFEVREGEVTAIDLSLRPEPVQLDTLTVRSRRQRIVASLRGQGFYERQTQGMGTFLTSEQIRRWPAISVGDVLRHAPFVHVEPGGVQGSRILISKFGMCAPTIYVDGNRIRGSPDDWARPEDIVAVEVYRGTAQVPMEWGMNETCGVILIWTNTHLRGG